MVYPLIFLENLARRGITLHEFDSLDIFKMPQIGFWGFVVKGWRLLRIGRFRLHVIWKNSSAVNDMMTATFEMSYDAVGV